MAENINNSEQYGDYPSKAWDNTSKVLAIPSDVYAEFAGELKNKIEETPEYVPNAIIPVVRGEMTYVLEGSFVIYYERYLYPDGVKDEIVDIVPTWSEIHAYKGEDMDEVLCDGNFNRVKELIIKR